MITRESAREIAQDLVLTCSRGGTVRAVALIGSTVTGSTDSFSDVDFFVLRDGPTSQGRRVIEGHHVEWFADSTDAVLAEISQEQQDISRPVSSMWANAIPVFDPEELCNQITEAARRTLRHPCPPLETKHRIARQAIVESLLEDAEREIYEGRPGAFICILSAAVVHGLALLCQVNGECVPASKEMMSKLRDISPALHGAINDLVLSIDHNAHAAFLEFKDQLVTELGGFQKEFNLDELDGKGNSMDYILGNRKGR